jgi:type II secretory pathway component PulK
MKHKTMMKQRRERKRRGAALVVALVCLVIVTALVGTMLVGAMRSGRQLRVERNLRQCELLLQAGLDRAAAQLTDSPATYAGETWDVPSAEIGGDAGGQVTIQVTRPSDELPQVRVLAEYPLGSEHSIRRSRNFQLPTTSPLSPE